MSFLSNMVRKTHQWSQGGNNVSTTQILKTG